VSKRAWRGKKKRRCRSRKMPESVKQKLAEAKAVKNTANDDDYMERFRKSQKALVTSSQQTERRIQALRCGYFRAKYGDVWREVMQGYQDEAAREKGDA